MKAPPPRRPIGRRVALAMLCGFSSGASACGDEPTTPTEAAAAPAAVEWSERLAEPTVDDLLAALAQPHAMVRPRVGPHRLHTSAELSLTPTVAPPALPALDAPVVTPHAVVDEVTLVWASTDEDDPRVSLQQGNDHDRGRRVVVVGTTVYSAQEHRGWYHYERDSDLVEQWLTDAQLAPHDIVQLAAPRLAITAQVREGQGIDGGEAVEITLDLAEQIERERIASGPTRGWRQAAQIEAISGHITVDAASGAWLDCDVDVRYRVVGADEAPHLGHVTVRGTVQPGPQPVVTPPPDSRPLPGRIRYADQQQRVLHGLAAP